MKCWKCENELPDNTLHCDACGAKQGEGPPSSVGPAEGDSSAPGEIQPGTVIANKFRVVEEIGRGGMAIVYKALDFTLNQHVALKTLPPRSAYDPSYLERFLSEAQRMAMLRDHPNIVTVYEAGRSNDIYFIAMALVDGLPLMDWRHELGADIDEKEILEVMRKIALAVHHAHINEIIHRDIKPSNILMKNDGEPVLTDFGLARGVSIDDVKITTTGVMLGTPAYMSPEQAGSKEVTYLTDIYSLGVVFFEMLTGVLPFTGTVNSIMHSHAYKAPPQIRLMNPNISDVTSELVHRMLEKDPGKRCHSGKQVAKEIEAAIQKLESKDEATDAADISDYASAVDFFAADRPGKSDRRPLFAAAALLIATLMFFCGAIALKWNASARTAADINAALTDGDVYTAVSLLDASGLDGSEKISALSNAVADKMDVACMDSEDPEDSANLFRAAKDLQNKYKVSNGFEKCITAIMQNGVIAYDNGDLESARVYLELLDTDGQNADSCDFNWVLGLTYYGLGEKENAARRLGAVIETEDGEDWDLCDGEQAKIMLEKIQGE